MAAFASSVATARPRALARGALGGRADDIFLRRPPASWRTPTAPGVWAAPARRGANLHPDGEAAAALAPTPSLEEAAPAHAFDAALASAVDALAAFPAAARVARQALALRSDVATRMAAARPA